MKAALAACVLVAAAQLVSASSCDVSCSSFKSDTACQDGARTTCALCDWNTTTSTCDEEPNMCEEQCNNCRAFGPLICPAVNASADACQKLNTDDCVVCAWSGGACEKASCSASCPHFKTEAACMEATSGPCPFTCSWDVSKGECETVDDVSKALKTFVIILIVVGVVLLLGALACIVCCCCCTGAAAASMMSREQDTLVKGQHQHRGYTHQED